MTVALPDSAASTNVASTPTASFFPAPTTMLLTRAVFCFILRGQNYFFALPGTINFLITAANLFLTTNPIWLYGRP